MLHYIITQSEATNRSRKKDNEKKYVICQPNHPTQTHQKVLELCQGQLAPSPLVMCLLYLETEDRPCFKSYTHKIHTSWERELFVKCQFDIATTLCTTKSVHRSKKSKSFNLSSSSVHFSSDYTPLTYSMASLPCDLLPFD